MKFLKTLMIVFASGILISSCSKNDDSSKAPATIEGVWKGTVITEADNKTYFWSFHFKQGGVMDVLNKTGGIITSGTWSMENNILLGSYDEDGDRFSIIGTHNSNLGKILGNWGYGNSTTNGGTWQMTKQ